MFNLKDINLIILEEVRGNQSFFVFLFFYRAEVTNEHARHHKGNI